MRNLTRLNFAVSAWLLSVATVGYAAAFFGNFVVPRTIDSAAVVKFDEPLSVNLALIMLFGLQHVGMARPAFRYRTRRWIPGYAERGVYAIASSAALILLMLLWQPMGGIVWELGGAAAAAITALYVTGWAVVVGATLLTGHLDLLGVRAVLDVARGIPRSSPVLITRGLHRFVRQPIYLGWLLVLWSAPVMTVTRLLAAAGLTFVIVAGVLLEERELARAIPGYSQYCRKVPMLLPSLTRRLAFQEDSAAGTENG